MAQYHLDVLVKTPQSLEQVTTLASVSEVRSRSHLGDCIYGCQRLRAVDLDQEAACLKVYLVLLNLQLSKLTLSPDDWTAETDEVNLSEKKVRDVVKAREPEIGGLQANDAEHGTAESVYG